MTEHGQNWSDWSGSFFYGELRSSAWRNIAFVYRNMEIMSRSDSDLFVLSLKK